MEDFGCNILIMGKTGVGKSSLLNYLCGQNKALTGTGKPVTGRGFQNYDANINNQTVRIFDSWGLEADKTEEWLKILDTELEHRKVYDNPADWFHAIIYCIQAGGGRIEPIDAKLIAKFLKANYRVTVALTKADQLKGKENDKKKFIESIRNHSEIYSINVNYLEIVPVCSSYVKSRKGTSEPFGREKLVESILKNWKKTIMDRLPENITEAICRKVDKDLESYKIKIEREKKTTDTQAISEGLLAYQNIIWNKYFPEVLQKYLEKCRLATEKIAQVINANHIQKKQFGISLQEIGAITDFLRKHLPDNIFTRIVFQPVLSIKDILISQFLVGLFGQIDGFSKKLKMQIRNSKSEIAKLLKEMV